MDRKRTCPYCNGNGWYSVPHKYTGEEMQEECEACLGTGEVEISKTVLCFQGEEHEFTGIDPDHEQDIYDEQDALSKGMA